MPVIVLKFLLGDFFWPFFQGIEKTLGAHVMLFIQPYLLFQFQGLEGTTF